MSLLIIGTNVTIKLSSLICLKVLTSLVEIIWSNFFYVLFLLMSNRFNKNSDQIYQIDYLINFLQFIVDYL
jgi:hypothetical protein